MEKNLIFLFIKGSLCDIKRYHNRLKIKMWEGCILFKIYLK